MAPGPGQPSFFITTEELPQIPASYYTQGVKVLLYEYQRPFAEYKTTHYLPIYLMQPKMAEAGAVDILYHHQGLISECTRSNFFIMKNNQLLTAHSGMLFGITRSVILEIARKQMEVPQTNIRLSDLAEAQEAFKAGTSGEIIPIVQVDNQKIGNGQVGERTLALMDGFKAYAQASGQPTAEEEIISEG
ncbi:MAG: hypothetical protein HC880_10145 [Bacteroidia bacterium]|nr:hypothetical protein [Bacteroidia bacterium]